MAKNGDERVIQQKLENIFEICLYLVMLNQKNVAYKPDLRLTLIRTKKNGENDYFSA